jgi:uncharacterized membrane protein
LFRVKVPHGAWPGFSRLVRPQRTVHLLANPGKAELPESWLKLGELNPLARFWHLHIRLIVAAAFGAAVVMALLVLPWRMPTRILVGWDAGVSLYLVLIWRVAANCSVETIRYRAAVTDEGAIALLLFTTAAAVASLAAVIAELGHSPGPVRISLGIGTVLLSWLFMHAMFALHYAHEFYGEGRDHRIGGLIFPGDEDPDYWDFLYYSLVVAMTAQVSDVQISSKTIRRLTTVHGAISFFFNIAVLALGINIVSSLM